MNGGIILILIGGVFLLKNMGLLEGVEWGILWPIALILLGINMLLKKRYSANCGIKHSGTCAPRE